MGRHRLANFLHYRGARETLQVTSDFSIRAVALSAITTLLTPYLIRGARVVVEDCRSDAQSA